jgi:hypothetical protein
VATAHVYVILALLADRPPVHASATEDATLLMMIDLRPPGPPPPGWSADQTALQPRAAISLEPPDMGTSTSGETGLSIDWLDAGERAVAAAAAKPGSASRDLGSLVHTEPGRHAAKPFGWDKSQTERVQALPGAIRLRLGSHCEVVFAPLPVGGCSLGKIPARGDLFSEMSAPMKPGDWRDDSRTVTGR